MREVVFFVSICVFVNTGETVQPKSVNLALETVLQFDKKDQSADAEVLDRVQSFLDNIKSVIVSNKKPKRRSNKDELRLTDFLLEAAEILKKYDDNDLEDFFAVLDDQSRKYNYKGCKFYELVDNNDVRRYMSNKLEEAKDTSAKTMRRYLKDMYKYISEDKLDAKHRRIVDFVSSLYDGASDKFGNVVKSLRSYPKRTKDTVISLDDIVSNGLRTLVFDHYSNLNDNARQQLKSAVANYWASGQNNGDSHKKDRYGHDNKGVDEVQDYKSKLRVIDVPNKFSKNSGDRAKVKNLKGSSYKKDKRHKKKRITPKIDIDFIDFKRTTQKQSVTDNDDNTQRDEKPYSVTKGLIDEHSSNSYELKKPKVIEKPYKAIIPSKLPTEDETDKDTDSDKGSSGDSKDKKGISIEFANKKYIMAQKRKHKRQKIGHITYDVERRQKFKTHDYSDDDGSDGDSATDENDKSGEGATNPNKPDDSEESVVLIGGQNIHDMRYRAEQTTPQSSKIVLKEIVQELSAVPELPRSTKKSKDRQKTKRKSVKKTKNNKRTTPSDTEGEITTKAIYIQNVKDSAFDSSDEGITIETFENVKEPKVEKKHTHIKKPTSDNNVRKMIHNLEVQLEDVKQQVNLNSKNKVNITERDARKDSKVKSSQIELIESDEKEQTDAKVKLVNDYDIRANTGPPTNTDITEIKTTNRDATTAIEYETDTETKPNRTTAQETSENTKSPLFRSNVENVAKENSQEWIAIDNIVVNTKNDNKIIKSDKVIESIKIDDLKEMTSANLNTDTIFKSSENNITTSLTSDDVKSKNKENVTTTVVPEEAKREATTDKKEYSENVQITTVVDLTKHLKESDTVVVDMKDNTESTATELKRSTRDLSYEMDLPKPPRLKDGKIDINDLDLDFKK